MNATLRAAIADLHERHPTTEVARVVLSHADATMVACGDQDTLTRMALGGVRHAAGGPTIGSSRYLLPGQALLLNPWGQVVGIATPSEADDNG